MSQIDFEQIPDAIWMLFDEIIHNGNPVRLFKSDTDRQLVYDMARFWDPPLLEMYSPFLTKHGLVAYKWRQLQQRGKGAETDHVGMARCSDPKAEEIELLREKVIAVLTPNQAAIMGDLWERGTASFSSLTDVPGAFDIETPSHEAIVGALKRMKKKLEANELPVVLAISTAKSSVNLDIQI